MFIILTDINNHRTLVNLDAVTEIKREVGHDYSVTLLKFIDGSSNKYMTDYSIIENTLKFNNLLM